VKTFLLVVIVGPILIPILAARDGNQMRGLRRAILGFVIFNILYALIVGLFYPQFSLPS
jgi:hypothetical protein